MAIVALRKLAAGQRHVMQKSLRLLCALTLGMAAASATTQTQAQEPKQDAADPAQLPRAQFTHMDVSHGKPFVMVTIDGQGPFRFVIDTGTGGQAFISSALAKQLGLTQVGRMRLSDPTGKGSRITPMVLIPSLLVAGVEFNGVKAAVHDLDDSDGQCQGLLGFLLFRNYLLTLDYPNRQMRLSIGELAPDGEHSNIPFRMPDGIPLIPLHIGSTIIEAQLDSGGAGLSLPEEFALHMSFASDPVSFSNAYSITTRFQIKGGKLGSDVHLGDFTFQQPFIEINPAFPLANFGACPMQNFSITFDQKHTLVRFEAAHQVLHLTATPAPMHLNNASKDLLPDPTLVPVG
jgi:predicted aspartyl protease